MVCSGGGVKTRRLWGRVEIVFIRGRGVEVWRCGVEVRGL
jgi:hypothetical protein